jgi:hypothetical protein
MNLLKTRLVTAAAAVFALAAVCSAQEHEKATSLGNGAAFKGTTLKMKDKGQAAYILSFKAGKEFEATTDGTKNTDVNLYVLATDRLLPRAREETVGEDEHCHAVHAIAQAQVGTHPEISKGNVDAIDVIHDVD